MSEHANIMRDLSSDLAAFADALDRGPSGWHVMPLLAIASRSLPALPPERHERLRGAILAIVYGFGARAEATKASVTREIRRVASEVRTAGYLMRST